VVASAHPVYKEEPYLSPVHRHGRPRPGPARRHPVQDRIRQARQQREEDERSDESEVVTPRLPGGPGYKTKSVGWETHAHLLYQKHHPARKRFRKNHPKPNRHPHM